MIVSHREPQLRQKGIYTPNTLYEHTLKLKNTRTSLPESILKPPKNFDWIDFITCKNRNISYRIYFSNLECSFVVPKINHKPC